MKRFLTNFNILLSRLSSLGGSRGQLHHARFGLPHELAQVTGHTLDGQHLLLGRSPLGGIYRVAPSKQRPELGHMLVIAPPRSGKSLLAASQILTWPGSLIIVDIKGELYASTAGYRSTLGLVYVIDPRGLGNQYDPLGAITEEDDLFDAAQALLFDPREGEGRSFTEWGILLEVLKWQACLALNRQTGTHYRFLPFSRALSKLGINPAAAAINAISPALAQELLDGEYDPEFDYRDNKYFANSWQGSRARMFPLQTEHVVRSFNGSDFTGADVIAGDKPVTMYLRIPERMLKGKAPLIRLVLESLTNEMFRHLLPHRRTVCFRSAIWHLGQRTGQRRIEHLLLSREQPTQHGIGRRASGCLLGSASGRLDLDHICLIFSRDGVDRIEYGRVSDRERTRLHCRVSLGARIHRGHVPVCYDVGIGRL